MGYNIKKVSKSKISHLLGASFMISKVSQLSHFYFINKLYFLVFKKLSFPIKYKVINYNLKFIYLLKIYIYLQYE